MSSEEYYSGSKYPSHGQDYGSQSCMPPAGYSAYPSPAAAYPPGPPGLPSIASGNSTAYPQQNSSGYQYQPQEYYGGYQQPPPPYYQHPASPAPAQSPYSHLYQPQPPLQPQQPQTTYPQGTDQDVQTNQDPNDRGVLGALAGGAAGAYAGHQVHHGVLGTIGGAIAGSLAEDAMKKYSSHGKVDEEKEKKSKSRWGFHRRRSSSLSSSSSSSDSKSEKEDAKPPVLAPAPSDHRGNFSKSSKNISLQGNYELVASCCAVSGRFNVSRLPLNSVLTNEFGHFKWKSAGNFGASARNARLTEGGRVLEAELADGKGVWRRDWVRLDERISNRDGVLVFLD
ncbi:CVNH domain-containing protein [Aspergillus recurvatus]